jgi:glycosyltransferase involved in cell wall biosynthesis
MSTSPDPPLVSIVITTYNHARYLPDAVKSVLQQDYSPIELIVVDDGSTDHTPGLMVGYPSVRYIRQVNQGLAAARNTGLAHATGEWICFLDADDALLPNAMSTQIRHAANQTTVGFISGGHLIADEDLKPKEEVAAEVRSHHYKELLQRNYIGMHAAVLYCKSVLQEYPFDSSFTGCEDYDVYLRISAQHPVITHTQPVAVYRTLRSSMSGNLPMMLRQAHKALEKQKPLLKTTEHKDAYQKGLHNWNDLYCYAMANEIEQKEMEEEKRRRYLRTLLKCKPKLYIRHYINKIIRISKSS